MATIHDICDYVIYRLKSDDDTELNNLKLQKLLYYIQAWNLAFNGQPMFAGKFQAWVHGPVNREIYDRYKDSKSLYSNVSLADVNKDYNEVYIAIGAHNALQIDKILQTYAGYSSAQLEKMTHDEDPWIEARKGVSPISRCENEISEETMRKYYAARLA